MMPQDMDDKEGLSTDRDPEIDFDNLMADLNGGEAGEDDAEFDDYGDDQIGDYEDAGDDEEDEDNDPYEGDDDFYDLDDADDEEDEDEED